LRSARPDPQLAKPERGECLPVAVGDEAGAVVGHDRPHAYTVFGKPGDGSAHEVDGRAALEIVEHLGVCEPRVVVDHHVHVLETGDAALAPVDAALVLASSLFEDAVASPAIGDAGEAFDVDVDELARVTPLLAVGRLGWGEA
jgi:hypothetical protein